MNDENPFAQEWRDCLQSHYTYVVRSGDTLTEATLSDVMREAGFTEAAIAELGVRASIRADEVPEGFVPDLDALADALVPQAQAVPAEAALVVTAAIPAPQMPDPVLTEDEMQDDDDDLYLSGDPQQLSLF